MMKCFKSTMLVAALVGCVGAWAAGNGNGNGHGTERGNGADHPVRTQTPAEAMGNPQGLSGRPGSAKGLLRLNQHVYYAGDTLQVRVVYPRSLQAIWSGDARGHLVVYVPTGAPVTVPLPATVPNQPIQVLDLTNLDTSQFAEGNYQIALVLTAPEGDPLKLGDWYAGFRGLLSVEQFKIRASATTPTPNTEVEGDTDGDGFEDVATGTTDDEPTGGTGGTGTGTGTTTGGTSGTTTGSTGTTTTGGSTNP